MGGVIIEFNPYFCRETNYLMTMKYYIYKNGQQSGPFDKSELVSKGLDINTMVWCEGMPNWMPVTHVPEIAVLLSQVPPAPPQPQPLPNPPAPKPNPGQGTTVDFGQAINICFKKYADFDGRASMSEYLFFVLFSVPVIFVTMGLGYFVVLLPLLAACSRRLHDTGRSGWWQLLNMVPLANILLLVWLIEASHDDNEYGPRP